MVRERAQLLLVGSVLIAIAIVATVVLLNSIYTPANLQTDDIEQNTEQIDRMHDELRVALGGLFLEVDAKDGMRTPFITNSLNPAVEINDTFQENVSVTLGPAYADVRNDRRSGTLDVEYLPEQSEKGWAVYQNDNTTYHSGASPAESNWTVADGDPDIVRMRMTMYDPGSTPFSLKVNESGGPTAAWYLNVSDTRVTVNRSTGSERAICGVSGNLDSYEIRTEITKNRGHVELHTESGLAHRCGDFRVAPDVTSQAVHFIRGDTVSGNYTITGTDGTPSFSEAPELEGSTDTIVNPAFAVTYVSSGVTYESTFQLYNRTEP